MNDREFDKARRRAKLDRDKKIQRNLQNEGRKPKKRSRRNVFDFDGNSYRKTG